jgi:hypothetical protein
MSQAKALTLADCGAAFWGLVFLLFAGLASPGKADSPSGTWRGIHLWLDRESSAQELIETLPALAKSGANVVVLEVNYSFEFQAHPELRTRRFITRDTAHQLAAAARHRDIRLIPEFNCLGHQSFAGRVEPLLKVHPEFSETPIEAMQRTNFYSLSWCPRSPGLNDIVFSLIDEIAEGFEADAVHVGMDEVYYIGEEECPRCRGKHPAELFAAQVNALHAHIVGQKKMQMLMWADRVIGPEYQGCSKFDSARNDLSGALDLIPRDIVMCDWHYEWKTDYPSIRLLAARGFRVWPAGFLPLQAAQQLSDVARAQRTNVVGYLATTWNQTSIASAPDWPPIKEILPRWVEPDKRFNAPPQPVH